MKLRGRFLSLLVPCVSVPLVLVGALAYVQLSEGIEDQATTGVESLLDQVTLRARSYRERLEADVELFTGSEVVRTYLLVEDERDRFMLYQSAVLDLFASYRKARPEYYELRILLPDGYEDTRSSSLTANVTDEEAGGELFRRLQAMDADVVSFLQINPDNGQPALYAARRVELADTARFGSSEPPRMRGFLVVTSSLDFLARSDDRHEGARIVYTDADARPLELDGAGHALSGLSSERLRTVFADALETGPSWHAIDGEEHLLFGRSLYPDLNAFVALPAASLSAAATRMAWLVSIVTLVAIAFTAALLYRSVSALLIAPLRRLGDAVHAVGEGALIEDLGIGRRDEIGALATRFEEMSVKLRRMSEETHHLAHHDSLTDLPNRRLFLEQLERSLASARRQGHPCALLFLDLDDFKRVNDTLGHAAGDELLQEIARRMLGVVRREDGLARITVEAKTSGPPPSPGGRSVARLGGDEFVALLPQVADAAAAARVARRVLDALADPFDLQGHEFHVGASIGITLFPRDGESVDELLRSGDLAMYHAKSRGKRNYQFFDPVMNAAAVARLELEGELRRALAGGELVLHFQPQIDLESGAIVAVEALVRWQHPRRGLLAPAEFVGVAEECGLIAPLGEWVLREACAQLGRWSEEGLGWVRMTVNVSSAEFRRPDFQTGVVAIVTDAGIDPGRLELEVTETGVMDAVDRSAAVLSRLKQLGVGVAMDYFGTGYSSLGALSRTRPR